MQEPTHKAVMLKLGFTNMLHVNAIGYSGEMIMQWREHEIAQVDPIAVTYQKIHANVQVSPSGQPWILFIVYANIRFNDRKILWENLEQLSASHNNHGSYVWF